MLKPRKYNDHQAKLTPEMVVEMKWLKNNSPALGNSITAEYTERAKAFNAKCKEIGATVMMVIEK